MLGLCPLRRKERAFKNEVSACIYYYDEGFAPLWLSKAHHQLPVQITTIIIKRNARRKPSSIRGGSDRAKEVPFSGLKGIKV